MGNRTVGRAVWWVWDRIAGDWIDAHMQLQVLAFGNVLYLMYALVCALVAGEVCWYKGDLALLSFASGPRSLLSCGAWCVSSQNAVPPPSKDPGGDNGTRIVSPCRQRSKGAS